nr:hypothetical protein [Tanacetum cinerariifolium]
LKRKGLNLEKEKVKKQKSSEEAPEIETSTGEFTKEKVKEMIQLVPVEDVYVQALQVKHPIIDWKVHTVKNPLKVNAARLKLTTARVYDAEAEQNLPSPSNDPLPSGKDSLKLKELMELIKKLKGRVERLEEESRVLKELKSVHYTDDADEPIMKKEKSSKQGRKIADIDADVEINLEKAQAEAYNLDLDHQEMVLSMMDVNEEESANVEEVVEVVKAAKLMTKVVTTVGATKVSVLRKRRGVIIQDPEETTTTAIVHPKVQGKAILIEELKPLKRQAQIELDKEVARQLEAELNTDINWNDVIEQVKRNERLNDDVMKYQTLKRKPLTQAQAKRNMIVYLKNMVGFKMDYFKGMIYDKIRPIFVKHYNHNQTFLDEVNEGVKVSETEVRQKKDVEVESSEREGESLEQEIAKKQKIEEETEELKKHLQIVTDDDDVYTDATPLASKIPIVDYKIHTERNKPYFKIIRADGNHMMYPLTHFTLEQMLNNVRLQVKEESEMSLELLRLVKRQLNEGEGLLGIMNFYKLLLLVQLSAASSTLDKGKGIMIEELVKPKKKDQIRLDEEAALKLQAEFDEEERLARGRAKKEQEANIALIET